MVARHQITNLPDIIVSIIVVVVRHYRYKLERLRNDRKKKSAHHHPLLSRTAVHQGSTTAKPLSLTLLVLLANQNAAPSYSRNIILWYLSSYLTFAMDRHHDNDTKNSVKYEFWLNSREFYLMMLFTTSFY
jgi:hypothetical protein